MTILTELRGLVPNRRVTRTEAFVIAEQQATLLLSRAQINEAPVPSTIVTELPFVTVATRMPMASSGATKWIKPQWVVLLNGLEPVPRQKFSLGHELYHVIMHPYAAQFFVQPMTAADRRLIESLCDYFAGCLWMPRKYVKRDFARGMQDYVDLARHYAVSPQAMHVRLLQLGLTNSYGRHSEMDNTYLRSSTASPLGQAA
jgi:Zn-dependent peptidase ImmA (M78 family)